MSNPSALTLANLQDKFRKALKEDNWMTNLLAKIEAKTKINREFIAYGIIGFLAIYLIVGWGNDFLCNLIGFAYPAYQSIKAIESPTKDDDTKWLMYWSVYSLFGLLEYFGDHLLFWIPLYTLTKCLFLLWLMVPGKNGGTYLVYNKVLRPFVIKHQDQIDKSLGQAREAVDKVIKDQFSNKEK